MAAGQFLSSDFAQSLRPPGESRLLWGSPSCPFVPALSPGFRRRRASPSRARTDWSLKHAESGVLATPPTSAAGRLPKPAPERSEQQGTRASGPARRGRPIDAPSFPTSFIPIKASCTSEAGNSSSDWLRLGASGHPAGEDEPRPGRTFLPAPRCLFSARDALCVDSRNPTVGP